MLYGTAKQKLINGIDWASTSITILVVGARVLSRSVFTKNFGLDDALIIFALLFQVAYVCALTVAVAAGTGRHFWTIPAERQPLALFRQLVASSISVLTFALPKLAIVALLERLLSLRPLTRIIFWTLSVGEVGCCLLAAIIWSVQCTPRASQWDKSVPGHCWSPSVLVHLSYFLASFSVFLDFLFAVFPPFVIAKLHMPLYKRIAISVALGGGIFSAIVACYKISLISGLNAQSETDPTNTEIPLLICTVIEVNIQITAASLPAIGPFIRYVRQKVTSIYTRGSGNNYTPGVERSETLWGTPGGRTRPSHWRAFVGRNHNGMTSLDSQTDDVQLVDMGQERDDSQPSSSQGRPRPGRNEIMKRVDIEASQDDATSLERVHIARPNFNMTQFLQLERRGQASKLGGA